MLTARVVPRPVIATPRAERLEAGRHQPLAPIPVPTVRPTYLTRRHDSTTPVEAPLHDTTAPSAAPPRPAYLRTVDPTLAEAARTPETAAPSAGPESEDAGATASRTPSPSVGDQSDPEPTLGEEGGATGDLLVEGPVAAGGTGALADSRAGAAPPAGPAGPGVALAARPGAGAMGAAPGEAAAGVPLPETGSLILPVRALILPLAASPFDAPRRFSLVPLQPVKERTPDIERHAQLFEAAIEAAARFAADLIADAMRDADLAQGAERRRAADRQANLDAVLTDLDQSLDEARAMLAAATRAVLALIERRARLARMRIGGAASRAHGRRTGEIDKIVGDLASRRSRADGLERGAQTRHSAVQTQGNLAAGALGGLAENPAGAFPLDANTAMVAAQNEAIVDRLPPRATERQGKTARDAGGLFRHLQPAITNLHTNITNAFSTFDGVLTSLRGPAKQAVDRARDQAWKQVRDTARALRDAVEQGRTSAETALVQQHAAARRQMTGAARTRAEQERTAAERNAAGRISTATSLAGNQPATVRAVLAGLEPARKRPPADFATIVVRSAQGMRERITQNAASQRPRLARSVPQANATLDETSATTSTRMLSSAAEIGGRFIATSEATGDALNRQVQEGTERFTTIAQPVARSISGFIDPIERTYTARLNDLDQGLRDAGSQLDDAFAGRASSAGTGGANARAPPAPGASPDAPTEAADDFVRRVAGVIREPRTDGEIAGFADRARGAVRTDVQNRANNVSEGLKGFWGPDVERVMTGLRGLTRLRANALKEYYAVRPGRDIVAAVQIGLRGGFSAPGTIRHNVEAALNYLNGDAEKGALSEMQAAVNLWNDEARVERVQRSLTPAQMTALSNMPGAQAVLADIQEDLGGRDAEVFAALREATPEGIGRASAIRLQQGIDRARETRGYRGADRTVDALVDANRAAGADRLSGADEFPQLERDGVAEARREAIWNATVTAFAARNPLPEDTEGPRDARAALVAYATNTRSYQVYVPDERVHDYEARAGPRGHWETRREAIAGHQHTLIENIVRHGPDSAEARGARMAVEMNRPGGRPDPARLALATGDDALNPSLAGTSPEAERRRADALATNDRAFMLYWQYTQPEGTAGPPPPPDVIRAGMQAELRGRYAGDPAGGEYAVSLARDPRAATDRDYANAAVSAFNYALSRPDVDVETLRRTFRGLSFDQAELANRRYNEEHPGGPSLYARLGIHGEGDYWGSIMRGTTREGLLSGDQALEIERASLGTPTNDSQRFMLAALTARQQIRESGWLGRLLASDEYGHLQDDYANLLRVGGVSEGDFDSAGRMRFLDPRTGQLVRVGRFDEHGNFLPPVPGSTEELEAAMDLAKLSAENYTAATDRIASAITTALVVVAAVVTTVLTAGAAASIWIPVMVTAGAGLIGMGLTASIKGGRYSRDEMVRDLAMTIITAATAGIGAAAGTALRGGMPALRAAAGGLRVSEGAMKAALTVAGRGAALRGSLTLVEEMMIGGVTNSLNSMGGAMVDPALRRSENPGGDVLHAGFRGLFGGMAGTGAMRPFARFAQSGSPVTRAMGRAAGQGLSGSGTRATEIGYEGLRGAERRTGGEIASDIFQAGAIGTLQGFAEARAEDRGRAYFGRREARAEARPRAAEEVRRDAARPVEPSAEIAPRVRPAPAPEPGAPAPRPPPSLELAAPRRPAAPPELPAPRATPLLPAPEIEAPRAPVPRATGFDQEPTPSILRPEAEGVSPTRTAASAGGEAEPQTPLRPAPGPAGEVEPAAQRRGGEEPEPATRRRPTPPEDAPRATARRRAEAAVPVLDELPEGSAMMPPNPKSRTEALEMLRNSMQQEPHREVAVYVNTETGEHVLIQGTRDRVFVDRDAQGNPVGILGEGNPQRWKELLDSDRGDWQLVAHNHPGEADASRAGYARRLPSGRGGDFGVIIHESAALGGKSRHSAIHVTHEGRTSVTEFAYDPGSPRPFAIIYDDPATGQRVFRRFASLESYGELFENLSGISPHLDEPGSPAATSPPRTEVGTAPAGRGRSAFATGGGPGEATPLKPTPDNPSARTDNCGFCAISHALLAETGARPPGGADGLHAAATERLQSRSAGAVEPPPHTLYADPLPRGTTDLTVADLRAARGPVGGGEGVFGPGDWTLARQAEVAGLRVNRMERGQVARGAEFLNPARQGEHVEAAARRRAAARGADFDDLSEPQQDSMRAAARAALERDAAGVPGSYIAHVGQRNGGDHFVNVSIDANGSWTTYDAQSGVRGTGPPRDVQRLWKVSAPEISPGSPRGSGGDGGQGGGAPVPASAARRAQTREDPARTRAHDVEELFAEVQSELDRPPAPPAAGPVEPTAERPAPRAAVPPAEAGTLSQPTLERLQAGARQVADAALAEMRAARGVEAARQLEELILLAPGVMMGRPEAEIPATSRGPRWGVGLLDASSETVRDRRFAELPDALGRRLVLDAPSRERLAALLRARRAAARPGESRGRRAAEVNATIARWEQQGMSRRELRAYAAQARRLETYARGEAGFGTARRQAMQAEEDTLRGAVDQRMRRAPHVRERDLLRQILKGTGEDWLAVFARGSMPLRGTQGWDLIEQWHAYLDNLAANNRANPRSPKTPSQDGFERYMRRYMKGTQRPRLSELTAAETVSQRAQDVLRRGPGDPPPPGLEMLKIALDVDLDTRRSRNEPSEPGTDFLGLRPGDGVLVYGDDKAHQATRRNRGAVEDVEAFVPGLARNMRADADALATRFAALRERGLAVEDRHAAVPGRLRACATELEAAFPRGINLRGRRAQARFRRILARHKLELIVTAAAVPRGVDRVAPRVARAGVRFLPRVPRSALEEDEEPRD